MDIVWIGEGTGDHRLAARRRQGRPGGRPRHAALQSRPLPRWLRGMRGGLSDRGDSGARRRARRRLRPLHRLSAPHRGLPDRRDGDINGLGVRGQRPQRPHMVRRRDAAAAAASRRARAQGVPAQLTHPPRRCRLLQRLRVRTPGAWRSLLQSASVRRVLHAVAALRRSSVGHGAGHRCHARAAAKRCRSRAG